MSWFVAHQGGWDEIALFLGPIVLAFVVVRGLERRHRRNTDKEELDGSGSPNTHR